ncbi:MAG: hypothetical protein RQ715_04605 [Methylococcales bacterium]|nr:hypothetical protein [Methylococcales bacterium]
MVIVLLVFAISFKWILALLAFAVGIYLFGVLGSSNNSDVSDWELDNNILNDGLDDWNIDKCLTLPGSSLKSTQRHNPKTSGTRSAPCVSLWQSPARFPLL